MLKNVWNSKLFQILVSATLSIVIVFLSQGLKNGREDAMILKAEFDKRPTTGEVNLRFDQTKVYIDERDAQIMRSIDQHSEESIRASKAQLDLIKSMDRKINILINHLK